MYDSIVVIYVHKGIIRLATAVFLSVKFPRYSIMLIQSPFYTFSIHFLYLSIRFLCMFYTFSSLHVLYLSIRYLYMFYTFLCVFFYACSIRFLYMLIHVLYLCIRFLYISIKYFSTNQAAGSATEPLITLSNFQGKKSACFQPLPTYLPTYNEAKRVGR